MARSIDAQFYNSKRWRRVAAEYKKHCGGLCSRCKARGIYKAADIVHHKTHLTAENVSNPSIAYSFDNLECLCINCHNETHFGRKAERRRYEFGKDGQILI